MFFSGDIQEVSKFYLEILGAFQEVLRGFQDFQDGQRGFLQRRFRRFHDDVLMALIHL